MKKTLFLLSAITVSLLLGIPGSMAMEIKLPRTRYYGDSVENHEPGEKPEELPFPMVHYFFAERFFMRKALARPEVRERFKDGISLPIYIGYLVVSEDYTFKFVDKSNGLCPEIEEIVDRVNSIDKDGFYYFCIRNECWVPRWSWNGYSMIMRQEVNRLFDNIYDLYGEAPIDDLVPEYEEECQTTIEVISKGPLSYLSPIVFNLRRPDIRSKNKPRTISAKDVFVF